MNSSIRDRIDNELKEIAVDQQLKNKILHNIKNNKRSNNHTLRFAYIAAAATACVVLTVLAFAALIKAPEEQPKLAESSPTPTISSAQTTPPEHEIPEAYSQRLCSVAVQSAGWIYYSNPEDNYTLYKVNQDTNETIKLSDDRIWGDKNIKILDIRGDWIFYTCDNYYNLRNYYDLFSSQYPLATTIELVKIKTDGSNRTSLYRSYNTQSGFNVEIIDGYIYVIDDYTYNAETGGYNEYMYSDSTVAGTGIYKMHTNDSELMPINSDFNVNGNNRIDDYAINDGWIYYYTSEPEGWKNGYKLYKIRLDGTEKTFLRGLDFSLKDFIGVSDEGIIIEGSSLTNDDLGDDGFIKPGISSEQKLFKIGLDGKSKEAICDNIQGSRAFEQVIDNYVYFTEDFSKLYRININTGEKTFITDDADPNHILIDGEWIYYSHYLKQNYNSEIAPLYRIKTDGTQKQKMADGSCFDMHLVNDELYFTKYDKNTSLFEFYKINKEGTGEQKVGLLNKIIKAEMLSDTDNEINFADFSTQTGEELLKEENINGISIGMPAEKIEAVLGNPDNPDQEPLDVAENDEEDGYDISGVQYRYDEKTIELFYVNQIEHNKFSLYLACFGVNSNATTLRGVGIGSTKEEIIEAYKNEYNADHTKGFENQLIVVGNKNCGIVFFLDETSGKVESFVIGRSG